MHRDRFSTLFAWILTSLFLLALVALAAVAPRLVTWAGGLALYLALLPAFVLPYLYEWRGAAVAFVLGEVALFASAIIVMKQGVSPDGLWPVQVALVVVSIGAGQVTTLLHRSRIEAEEKALSDPGTGLPNRRHALIHLKRGFAAAGRGSQLTVVAFDLDNFKQINDRHGHAVGDQVLATFGGILKERTREMNLSARVGGEEFISILESSGLEGAVTFAEEVRVAMERTPFSFGTATVSAGVASYEKGMASPEVLRAAADHALYHAKTRGRNQVAVVGVVPTRGKYRPVHVEVQQQAPGKGERLLIVDDDAEARGELSRALRRSGFDIIEADSAEQAIRIVRGLGSPPDLVITDLIVTSMTGFRMVDELRKIGPSLRALYLTSRLPDDGGWERKDDQSRRFLRKPVSLDEVTKAIRQLLDNGDTVHDESVPAAVRPPGSRRIHIMASHDRRAAGLSSRLRRLGYDQVMEVRGDVVALEDPPDLLVVRPEDPVENMLGAVETYLGRWSSESRPGVLLLAFTLPPKVASRWPALFPALLLRPDASPEEMGISVRHLLEVRSLRERYQRGQRGMAAQVAARSAELESQKHDLLLRLARVAELRDDLTGKHAERVGWLAGRLAAEIGLPDETVELITHAGPLHDLGKIATPDAILNKPDALTHIERDLMRQHTVDGAQLLSGSGHRLLQEAERIARSHHERWDGKGYPQGLRGDEIPISARIVAVADAYDCITHTRSYREALSPERAVEIIKEDSGSHFDPVVAAALVKLAERDQLAPQLHHLGGPRLEKIA
ncbi:MAG: diguanylate cyclase [Gemmatimonadota bacterium]